MEAGKQQGISIFLFFHLCFFLLLSRKPCQAELVLVVFNEIILLHVCSTNRVRSLAR